MIFFNQMLSNLTGTPNNQDTHNINFHKDKVWHKPIKMCNRKTIKKNNQSCPPESMKNKMHLPYYLKLEI